MASKIEVWAEEYRRAAEADEYREVAARLADEGYVDPDGAAREAVDDTIRLVELICDPDDAAGLLPLQVYDRADARARYVLSFQGGEHEHVLLYCDDLCRSRDLRRAAEHDGQWGDGDSPPARRARRLEIQCVEPTLDRDRK